MPTIKEQIEQETKKILEVNAYTLKDYTATIVHLVVQYCLDNMVGEKQNEYFVEDGVTIGVDTMGMAYNQRISEERAIRERILKELT